MGCRWMHDPHVTPCPQKGPQKNYEIFFIAFELRIDSVLFPLVSKGEPVL
jgi:hypothetical protein